MFRHLILLLSCRYAVIRLFFYEYFEKFPVLRISISLECHYDQHLAARFHALHWVVELIDLFTDLSSKTIINFRLHLAALLRLMVLMCGFAFIVNVNCRKFAYDGLRLCGTSKLRTFAHFFNTVTCIIHVYVTACCLCSHSVGAVAICHFMQSM